jgi:hypothetical protein
MKSETIRVVYVAGRFTRLKQSAQHWDAWVDRRPAGITRRMNRLNKTIETAFAESAAAALRGEVLLSERWKTVHEKGLEVWRWWYECREHRIMSRN